MHFTHADRISYGFYIMNSLPSAQKRVLQNFEIALKIEYFDWTPPPKKFLGLPLTTRMDSETVWVVS